MLEIGKSYTYKQMCEELNVERKRGNAKDKQLRDIYASYEFEKNGTKYLINKINSTEIIESDNRHSIDYSNFNVAKEYENSPMVYKIYKDKNIYIGQTVHPKMRYARHKQDSFKHGVPSKTRPLLDSGGIFEMIEIVENKEERLSRETYWHNFYKNMGYNVIDSELVLYKDKDKKDKNTLYKNKNKYKKDKNVLYKNKNKKDKNNIKEFMLIVKIMKSY